MDNPKFDSFRSELEARGYTLRALWSGKSHPDQRYDDVYCYSVLGTPRAAVNTLVVRHYQDRDGTANGYGLWIESATNAIADDVQRVIGA